MPSLFNKIKTVTEDIAEWVRNDFGLTTAEQFKERMALCEKCEEGYDKNVYLNTGGCRICGCSLEVKLKMITTECPLKKWGSIVVSNK